MNESLERLEVREGRKVGPDGENKATKLEQFNKGGFIQCTPEYTVEWVLIVDGAGKLLTTPSRLFKLLIPLTTIDHNPNHRGKLAFKHGLEGS